MTIEKSDYLALNAGRFNELAKRSQLMSMGEVLSQCFQIISTQPTVPLGRQAGRRTRRHGVRVRRRAGAGAGRPWVGGSIHPDMYGRQAGRPAGRPAGRIRTTYDLLMSPSLVELGGTCIVAS